MLYQWGPLNYLAFCQRHWTMAQLWLLLGCSFSANVFWSITSCQWLSELILLISKSLRLDTVYKLQPCITSRKGPEMELLIPIYQLFCSWVNSTCVHIWSKPIIYWMNIIGHYAYSIIILQLSLIEHNLWSCDRFSLTQCSASGTGSAVSRDSHSLTDWVS